jgi:hypothetical protein
MGPSSIRSKKHIIDRVVSKHILVLDTIHICDMFYGMDGVLVFFKEDGVHSINIGEKADATWAADH